MARFTRNYSPGIVEVLSIGVDSENSNTLYPILGTVYVMYVVETKKNEGSDFTILNSSCMS